jgi:hypothetical protein
MLLAFRVQDSDPAACSARFGGGIAVIVVSLVVALIWVVAAIGSLNLSVNAHSAMQATGWIGCALVVLCVVALILAGREEIVRMAGVESVSLRLELARCVFSGLTLVVLPAMLGSLGLTVALAAQWV